MAYIPQPYPKFKYHASEPHRIVASIEEEQALGAGWFDHPDLAQASLALFATPAPAAEAFDAPPRSRKRGA